jgi:hypothetical protein
VTNALATGVSRPRAWRKWYQHWRKGILEAPLRGCKTQKGV